MSVCLSLHLCLFVCVVICVYVCMYVYVSIYIISLGCNLGSILEKRNSQLYSLLKSTQAHKYICDLILPAQRLRTSNPCIPVY